MFRFKRYYETLLAEALARFGWEKLVTRPIGDSDRAPVAKLLVKRYGGTKTDAQCSTKKSHFAALVS